MFLFGNTWLIAWHVSYLDYIGGPYESGSHCIQCKDLPIFSTVLFCCWHYCITVIYYVLFCLINYFKFKFQVQVQDNKFSIILKSGFSAGHRRLAVLVRTSWLILVLCGGAASPRISRSAKFPTHGVQYVGQHEARGSYLYIYMCVCLQLGLREFSLSSVCNHWWHIPTHWWISLQNHCLGQCK